MALAAVRLRWPVDPQLAIAALASTAMTIERELTRDLRIVLMATLYASGGDSGVTL